MSIKFPEFSKDSAQTVPASVGGGISARAAMPIRPELPNGDYTELIERLFQEASVVALLGSSTAQNGDEVSIVTKGLATELGALGRRVVVVSFNKLIRLNVVAASHKTAFVPSDAPYVWFWPASPGDKREFFRARCDIQQTNWLEFLRKTFRYVLLDCPDVSSAPGVTEVAAMADAVVLAIEGGQNTRQQIQRDLQALHLRGANVAGCILIQRK